MRDYALDTPKDQPEKMKKPPPPTQGEALADCLIAMPIFFFTVAGLIHAPLLTVGVYAAMFVNFWVAILMLANIPYTRRNEHRVNSIMDHMGNGIFPLLTAIQLWPVVLFGLWYYDPRRRENDEVAT